MLALAHQYEAYIMPLNYNVLNSSFNNLLYAKDITCNQKQKCELKQVENNRFPLSLKINVKSQKCFVKLQIFTYKYFREFCWL